jgi:3-phosphoshikimate 1-carboxyvinyltransferase
VSARGVRFAPSGRLRGELTPPADKSISHRAAILGAMASEPVRIANFLTAADTASTLDAIGALGALVERRDHELVVRGTGLREARKLDEPIDVGNSGTLMRLLAGWLAGQGGGRWTLDGDASIRRRPVDRIAEPLRRMGAGIEARDGRYPPLTVHGAPLKGISYEAPVASAQLKSCLLLAGLAADGSTEVIEPAPSRDHTERLLRAAGVTVERDGLRVSVTNCDELVLDRVDVPGDVSSAAFMIVAALLVSGSRLELRRVGVNWTRCGLLRVVERMGGIVLGELESPAEAAPDSEPRSDLDVAAAPLVGTEVGPDEVPLLIDELPLVALLACFAEGETVVRGAGELRVKESDRIAAVVGGLRALGAQIEAREDGFVVSGTGGLRGGVMDSAGDHRLAMLGAVAGLASREGVEVLGMDAAAVSYPGFEQDLATLAQ